MYCFDYRQLGAVGQCKECVRAWIQIISRAPMSYLGFAMLWLLTVFVGGAIVALLQATVVKMVPYAGIFLGAMVSNLYWFLQAIIVGQFIRKNAAELGWD